MGGAFRLRRFAPKFTCSLLRRSCALQLRRLAPSAWTNLVSFRGALCAVRSLEMANWCTLYGLYRSDCRGVHFERRKWTTCRPWTGCVESLAAVARCEPSADFGWDGWLLLRRVPVKALLQEILCRVLPKMNPAHGSCQEVPTKRSCAEILQKSREACI